MGQVTQEATCLATGWMVQVRSRVSEGWRFFFARVQLGPGIHSARNKLVGMTQLEASKLQCGKLDVMFFTTKQLMVEDQLPSLDLIDKVAIWFDLFLVCTTPCIWVVVGTVFNRKCLTARSLIKWQSEAESKSAVALLGKTFCCS